MIKPTGGPAFPGEFVKHPIGEVGNKVEIKEVGAGMTLRDYYMAHAPVTIEDAMLMARIDASSVGMLPGKSREVVFFTLALMRGEYADAMIDARVTS